MSGATDDRPTLVEVLPKAGLVYLEKGNLSELLCKPKIMPIKSVSLERLEAMEQQAENFRKSNPTTAMPNSLRSLADEPSVFDEYAARTVEILSDKMPATQGSALDAATAFLSAC